MSAELLSKLEEKIDSAIETIELLRLQNEELEAKQTRLIEENAVLKEKQVTWEKNLAVMLEKLDSIEEKETAYSQQAETV